ncbi:phenol hydroxylase [Nitrogeniibacter mangrovi]|uniref:Phenol hydroxylase n=1 Tax=Nitrogeniibacter mangrovi TaxID=2016596 RepID=A0A6C1B4B4_9RHOO|nr:phenol hydroxylase [Nitrogeniibacter mangrovi]
MASETPRVDVTRKFVRLVERRDDGLVEFEFSIGLPELYVEMLLPADAYEAFCETNKVEFLEGPRPLEDTGADWEWRLRNAAQERFRSTD